MGGQSPLLRLSVAECTTTDEIRAAVGVLKSLAMAGDVKALALWLKYYEPPPGKRCAPVVIDEKQLETIEGCRAAYIDIMRELAAGHLDHESAAALRATVEGALKTHALNVDQEQDDSHQVQVIVQSYRREEGEPQL